MTLSTLLASLITFHSLISVIVSHDCGFKDIKHTPQPLPNDLPPSRILQSTTSYNLTIQAELNLQASNQGKFKAIRLSFDTSSISANMSSDKVDYLKNKLLPYTKQFFKSFLSVNPFPSAIRMSKPTNGEVCGSYVSTTEVDQKLFGDGWYETDMLFFVKAINDASSSYAAVATACYYDSNQFSRPVIGVILINAYYFTTNSYLNADRHLLTHEMMHALGFADNLYPLYRFDNGTLRGMSGVMSTTGGKSYIILPDLVTYVRSYYNCSSLIGASLEDEGSSASAGSHWEVIAIRPELMTPQMRQDMKVSKFTQLMFRGMGWYLTNEAFTQPTDWGKNKGCSFFTGFCNAVAFQETCTQTQASSSCYYDRSNFGTCLVTTFSNGCKISEGALLSCVEKPLSNENTFKSDFAMSFSDKSFCHESTVKSKSSGSSLNADQRCFTVECVNSTSYNAVFNDGSKYLCTAKGANITMLSTSSFNGYFTCADPTIMCGTMIGERCSGTCVYNQGYCATNNNCFYFNADNKCDSNCDVCLNGTCVTPGTDAIIMNNQVIQCHYSCNGCTNSSPTGCKSCKLGFKSNSTTSTCDIDCTQTVTGCANCTYSNGGLTCDGKFGFRSEIGIMIMLLLIAFWL